MEMTEKEQMRKADIRRGEMKKKGRVAKRNCYQEVLTADYNPIPLNTGEWPESAF